MNKEDTAIAQLLLESFQKAKDSREEEAIAHSFVTTLQRTHTVSKAAGIIKALEHLLEQQDGVIRATVSSARPLEHSEKQSVIVSIQKKYNAADVRINEHVDPSLLGGLSISIGDMLYDATLKHKLSTLSNTLIH